LPAMFKAETTTDRQLSMGAVLCSHYYSILTVLHRNLLPVKSGQPAPTASATKAISSARSCIHLAPSIRNLVPSSHHVAFFIQHLFSSAVIILLYAMGAPITEASHAAMDEAKLCLSALEAWEGLWPGARKCRELLMDLMENANQAVKSSRNTCRPKANAMKMTTSTSSGSTSPSPSTSPAASPLARLATAKSQSKEFVPAVAYQGRSTIRPGDSTGPRSPSLGHLPKAFSAVTQSSHTSPASSSHGLPSPVIGTQSSSDAHAGTTLLSFSEDHSLPMKSSNPFDMGYGPLLSPASHLQTDSFNWNNQPEFDLVGQSSFNLAGFNASTHHETPTYDETFFGYDVDMVAGPSSNSVFAASGLPFRGLDYIRNYTPSAGEPNGGSVWPALDVSAFGMAPDIPFSLNGESGEDHHG